MDKEEAQQEIIELVGEFASEYPSTSLALITGLFVGLLEHQVKEGGGDPTLEIKIDSSGRRDITVHKVLNELSSPAAEGSPRGARG